MSDSKEMLEATVKGLQEKCEQLTNDLQAKRRELEDINKPFRGWKISFFEGVRNN